MVKVNTDVIDCGTAVIYYGFLTLENVSTVVDWHGIFITFSQGVQWSLLEWSPRLALNVRIGCDEHTLPE